MTTTNFSLQTGETGPLISSFQSEDLRLSLTGMTPILSEGDQVLAGTKIAVASGDEVGDLHAPMAGVIQEVHPFYIHIKVDGNDRATPASSCPEGGEALRAWLRGMGVNVRALVKADTLIINAVPPEPGISIYDPLLRDYRKTMELGLEAVQRIVGPSKMYLVAANGNRANAFANCTVTHVAPVYPNGLDPLVIKAVTGKESIPEDPPEDTTILSVKELFFIGRVMESLRPLTETVMTIGDENHLVRIGTPVGVIAQELGTTVQPDERMILGGPLRGLAAVNLEQGVDKETNALVLLRKDESFETSDSFCIGCGTCDRVCPSRIMPGMISRCSEFKLFKRAESFHIHSCMECGLCSYWCTARRPLLHYIRLAKYELALLAGVAEPPRPSPEELEKARTGDAPC